MLAAFLGVLPLRAGAEEIATLEAFPAQGYGRMILTFKDRTLLPYYDAAVTSGVLRIAFENPIAIDVDDVPLQLSDYIAIARRDPDGSAIRFALKGKFRINTLEAGEKLFVDILPPNWQGLPPGLPDEVVRELAKRAEEAMRQVRALEQARLKVKEGPTVDLRIGEHPTFTRLVFDWSIRFDTAFVREEDIVRVTFNHPAQLDIGNLRARLPKGVIDATSFIDEGKLKFLMRLEPSVDIRAFREDQTYVIDITPESMEGRDPVNRAINAALSADRTEGQSEVIVAAGLRNADTKAGDPAAGDPQDSGSGAETAEGTPPQTAEAVPAPAPPPAATGDPPVLEDASVPPADEVQFEIQAAASSAAMPRAKPVPLGEQAPDAPSSESDAVPVEISAAPQDAGPASPALPASPAMEPSAAADTAPSPVPVPPAAVAPQAPEVPPAIELAQIPPEQGLQEAWRATFGGRELTAEPEEISPESPPADHAAEVRNFVSAEARRIGSTVRVVFPFREPVATSVFRRNNSLWMVFDTDVTIDVRGMHSALGDMAGDIVVTQDDGFQVLRVDVSSSALATVGAEGNAWNLVFGDMIVEPSKPLSMERNVRGDGGSVLRVPFKGPHMVRTIVDPFVGDTIQAATGFGPARGLLKPQSFVDLDALSSAHGVAVVFKSDGVTMEIVGDDVIIQKKDGLTLSNKHLRGGSGVFNSIADPDQPGYVEFVSLTTENPLSFLKRRTELENALVTAPVGRQRAARMDLARFYLAHSFAHEALGLMRLALEEDPALAEDSAFNLMMGAAQTLAGRPAEAYDHLNRTDLRNSPDAAVWQSIVSVALGDWAQARTAIPRGRAVIGNYPLNLQTEFNLAAAQTMVEVNDFGMANAMLAEIEPSLISSAQAARYDLLRGRVADASGRSLEALTAFDLVSRTDDRPRAAEARYRALRIRYRDGEIDIDRAIEDLAGLATAWRGDEIELRTLRFLAQLYAEKGRYREAFEAMKSAIQADPDSQTTRLLQEEMGALFASLFLDGKANEMSPVRALSLFYDFREMTPVGRQGDEMVRSLAKRLVEVDLLNQAAELLQHQVDNRLKGAARAQIAADLGAIYLMDRKPERALRVLNRTRQANLPTALDRQRNIVEARALTESGRPDLALELVRNMRGSDVDRLRADTFWAAQSWREAGEQLEAMYGSRWSDTIPLEELERNDILKAGIAYSLAGDQLSLDRLRTKYAPKMADSQEALAFEVVTRPIASQGVEFLEVAKGLAATDTLDTFLEEYRRQYMSPSPTGDQSVAASAPTGNG
ncbi:hypothetical protein [Polymorphum gilvum]|uniref:Tetratricopeptide repeat domain protein n=1 Tax=Polymorphum gilvum (strain LMG 25793 / CGMCC 1.9160 / SL003B-26A1) TaxID=991905 RepID=F2J445_POLGS|nr:hypothetical protein [Polymorphum gilvum]ADZ69971.1 Tetratricopeptide repeat domain protein [Polymorphum gilvum SL003B-26A1]